MNLEVITIALDKQFNLYLVDTGHFYSNRERYLHNINCKYRQERIYIKNKLETVENELKKLGYTEQNLSDIKRGENLEVPNTTNESTPLIDEYIKLNNLIIHKRQKAKQSKEKLLTLLKNKVRQNELTGGKDHTRKLRATDLTDNDVISIFDSALSRAIGIKQDSFTDDLMVVQVYYFDVFKDLCFYGFEYNGEKYVYFTSSAGQIRNKKGVFIKEATWNRIEKTVMCGLTIDKINSKGGNNVNKHLAYMALSNSATDEWQGFDIDKTIVIDDFETNVLGTYDFIDETDYSITRKTDYVPVPHTDGAVMMLPEVSIKNFMVRLPFIKGLLGVFDFKKFIIENNCSPIIKDIYGKERNVIEDDIQIIFTKSQTKMWKYYNSWEEYKKYFKMYNCQACVCNVEEDKIPNAKLNYQMLQTLTDITDEEIDALTKRSSERIKNVCSSSKTMMDILGIKPSNNNPTPFQQAIKLYPPLLSDVYVKDTIREVKNSLLKKYRSGKLEVTGKYTFVLPDFYAACEYWFGHIETPQGLLADGEVFCNLFRRANKLDCLRSPHLYREHPVRNNIACFDYGERAKNTQKWFTTNAVYTSTHDLITKMVQLDVDGDKLLVVADTKFIEIAERNMQGIVPLYYNMKKAEPTALNSQTVYQGLNNAFTGGNIGIFSNNISKIWNDKVFISGSETEKQQALNCIARLCCQNNFVIDYAKTLYKPEFPEAIKNEIKKYTNKKLPAFFKYAKDKENSQVENANGSFVNKLYKKFPNTPINTRKMDLGELDYTKLMNNSQTACVKKVSDLYKTLSNKYRYMVNMKDEKKDNLYYVAYELRKEFAKTGYPEEIITDMLVAYLFGENKRYKQLLWFCFGNRIVSNLKNNLPAEKKKTICCFECGEWFEVDISNKRTCRCDYCQEKYTRELKRKKQQEYRIKN